MTRWPRSAAFLALLVVSGQQLLQRAAASPGGGTIALPTRLAETGLFGSSRPDTVAAGTRPFAPQYALWSDGAMKRRWVYLPPGTRIEPGAAGGWDFPVGTRFWKEFSFGGRRVETRYLWKASDRGWLAASYAWNPEGTDAMLVPEEGAPGAFGLAWSRTHDIPARADCAACHGSTLAPLGFNPLQLSDDRDPNAIHGEPLTAGMVTLRTLQTEGLLAPDPGGSKQQPPRIATRDPGTRAVLGYLSANCGGCHNSSGEIAAQLPSLAYADVMADGEAVARRLAGQPSRWQAPGRPDGETFLIDPGSPQSSAILLRMRSRRPSSQMPPLGTVLPDTEAIGAISRWITAMKPVE
jgi:hypothetical protein